MIRDSYILCQKSRLLSILGDYHFLLVTKKDHSFAMVSWVWNNFGTGTHPQMTCVEYVNIFVISAYIACFIHIWRYFSLK